VQLDLPAIFMMHGKIPTLKIFSFSANMWQKNNVGIATDIVQVFGVGILSQAINKILRLMLTQRGVNAF
jgi:hypothetical protein